MINGFQFSFIRRTCLIFFFVVYFQFRPAWRGPGPIRKTNDLIEDLNIIIFIREGIS